MPSPRQRKIDLWLSRIGNTAQIVLSIVTVAALFYTVVPLYQKAVLEEAVAQKQVELTVVQAQADAVYFELRNFVRANIVIRAGFACTDLSLPVRELQPIDPRRRKNSDKHEHEHAGFKIDVRSCLQKTLNESRDVTLLKVADLEVLRGRIDLLGSEINQDRDRSANEFETIEERGARDPLLLEPPGEFTRSLFAIMPQTETTAALLEARVEATQLKIFMDYFSRARSKLLALRDEPWLPASTTGSNAK